MGVILKSDFLKVRRGSDLEVLNRAQLYEILDIGKVAHIGLADESGFPIVIPLAYVRDSDRILLHGSTGSRVFRKMAAGAKVCVTITLLDGLVLARSAFHSSMNYRSVMIFGEASVVPEDQKVKALELLTNKLIPDRWSEVRPMTQKEAAATMVLSISLENISGKVRTGGPAGEPESDLTLEIWAGEIPIETNWGTPIPAKDLPPNASIPTSIEKMR